MKMLNAFALKPSGITLSIFSIFQVFPQREAKKNVFEDGRNKILSFDSSLHRAASQADLPSLVALLNEAKDVLIQHNSDISRLIVRGIRKVGTDEEYTRVRELFLEHNRLYLDVRSEINGLLHFIYRPTPDGQEKADDFAMLSDEQNTKIFGYLLNVKLCCVRLEETWKKILPFEQKLFGVTQ